MPDVAPLLVGFKVCGFLKLLLLGMILEWEVKRNSLLLILAFYLLFLCALWVKASVVVWVLSLL